MSALRTTVPARTPSSTDTAPVTLSRAAAAALGAFLVAHGGAHVVGALEMWGLRHDNAALAMDTAIRYEGTGAALMGVAWCLGLVAMVLAGALLAVRHRRAVRVLTLATGLSAVICGANLPTAFIGLAIDAAILVVLAVISARARRNR